MSTTDTQINITNLTDLSQSTGLSQPNDLSQTTGISQSTGISQPTGQQHTDQATDIDATDSEELKSKYDLNGVPEYPELNAVDNKTSSTVARVPLRPSSIKRLYEKCGMDITSELLQSAKKLGIYVHYDEKRVIFCCSMMGRNRMNEYTSEANGIILERHTGRILCRPPISLRNNVDQQAEEFCRQGLYTVYAVTDGTAVNWYYTDRWLMATHNGFDMFNVEINGKTFGSHFTDCLAEYDLTIDQFTSQMATDRSYSFIFTHENIHKFIGKRSIKFIESNSVDGPDQSTDLSISQVSEPTDTLTDLTTCLANLSIDNTTTGRAVSRISDKDRKTSQYTELASFANIPTQRVVEISGKQQSGSKRGFDIKTLYAKCSSSLSDYLANCNVASYEPVLGYILRSRDTSTTKNHSNLYIESKLFKKIKSYWYNKTLNDMCIENKWDKETAVCTWVFLSPLEEETFTSIYPEYTDRISAMHKRLSKVLDIMCGGSGSVEDRRLANALLAELKSKCNLSNVRGQNKKKILAGYVRDVSFMKYFM